jgi:hypothetical protein
MRGWGWAAGVALLLAILSCTGPWWIHNLQMARFRWTARSILLTEGQVVGSSWDFGLLWGSSNHCDAQVWVAIESARPPEGFATDLPLIDTIVAPFGGPWLQLWDATDSEHLALIEDGQSFPLPATGVERIELDALFSLARKHPPAPGRHLYVLEAASQSYDPFDLLDPRCH